MVGEEEQPKTTNPKPLINASSYFLRSRNFSYAKTYALRAQAADPTNSDPPRLLRIISVLDSPKLSSDLPDHYAVLNLTRFESDPTLIRSTFEALTSVLNPNTNQFPLSAEAFDLVLKAWSVLSNPVEKARFDEELRRSSSSSTGCTSGSVGGTGTFWTMCPHCYYVYEYDRVYEECCLRCSNGKCRRAFQSVPILGGTPPPEVLEQGYYRCQSVVQCGDVEFGSWVPFAPERKRVVDDDDCYGEGFIIDISDEEDEEKGSDKRNKVEVDGKFVRNAEKDCEGDDELVGIHNDFAFSESQNE